MPRLLVAVSGLLLVVLQPACKSTSRPAPSGAAATAMASGAPEQGSPMTGNVAARALEAGPPGSPPGACPEGMVYVPAGEFPSGPKDAPKRVRVDAFCIDRTEVTVADFRRCVQARKCAEPPTEPFGCNYRRKDGATDHPITCIDFEDAESVCGFLGKRLPTALEWEYAARGPDGRPYPWGDEAPTNQPCWSGGPEGSREWKGSCPVNATPGDRAWIGILNLAGNVSEWTADACSEAKNGHYLQGSWWIAEEARYLRLDQRSLCNHAQFAGSQAGARCALSPKLR